MKTGVVVLNYNDSERSYATYKQYKKMSCVDYIVIVDNCSTDDSVQFLSNNVLDSELIISDKNGGYSYGNNFGVKYLDGLYKIDVFVISNPDVLVDEYNFQMILDTLSQHDYSVLTGVMKNVNGEISKMAYWRHTTFKDDLLSSFSLLRRYVKKYNYIGLDGLPDVQMVDSVPGSFFMIKASTIKEIDYFDENVFLYHEEDVLASKLKRHNFKTGIVTKASYIHNHKPGVMSFRHYKYLLSAKYYYQTTYNYIGFLKKCILRVSFWYSKHEYWLLLRLINLKRLLFKND